MTVTASAYSVPQPRFDDLMDEARLPAYVTIGRNI